MLERDSFEVVVFEKDSYKAVFEKDLYIEYEWSFICAASAENIEHADEIERDCTSVNNIEDSYTSADDIKDSCTSADNLEDERCNRYNCNRF
jgi:hypothetical protein